MLNNLESLPNDPAELQDMVTLLASELKNRDLKITDLKHQLAGHNRHRFGSKSESFDQLQLFVENEEIAAAIEETDTPEPQACEPKDKRKPLPEHLERNEQVLTKSHLMISSPPSPAPFRCPLTSVLIVCI